jgi:hypothetical protein
MVWMVSPISLCHLIRRGVHQHRAGNKRDAIRRLDREPAAVEHACLAVGSSTSSARARAIGQFVEALGVQL